MLAKEQLELTLGNLLGSTSQKGLSVLMKYLKDMDNGYRLQGIVVKLFILFYSIFHYFIVRFHDPHSSPIGGGKCPYKLVANSQKNPNCIGLQPAREGRNM